MKLIKVFILLFAFACPVYSQTVSHTTASEGKVEEHQFKHARVSVVLYHTHIGTHTQNGKEFISIPSIGFDVEYWFNPTWGIGSHNDLELINFEVKQGEHHSVERERPVLLTVDGLCKPWKGLVLLAGLGTEIEERERLFVLRGGLEYEVELKDHWDVAPAVFYDNRLHAYDTFSVGIGIGKRF
ncbi:hypothetical protein [Rufibacter sp. XAAS-G3-1]|uniref:hypothetical protein n=1 Tax=Rufibacter sp. XAAS-G3-1 TaxID=2729134 RepID=UPI0015E6A8A7|nr:hypothetical protein [Rufibacter sp. XAAS-G3-1]